MTDAQLKRLLEENNEKLFNRLDRHIDDRLEQNNAVLFGQLSRYFDGRINGLELKFDSRFTKIETALDGIVARLNADEMERAAINHEQQRQNDWIKQLADTTNTKLVPEP